jgi:NAD(P)-dependent dehydrogenase (short-subunit alcohol dehydrogenase family)
MQDESVMDEEENMKIAVIDGQGGGIGKAIIEKIKERCPEHEVIALGTNALASSAMLRAGADSCATGENAICYNVGEVSLILGTMGILVPNAMLGELSPAMAAAIGAAKARKILIPYQKCNVFVVGTDKGTLQAQIEEMVEKIISTV